MIPLVNKTNVVTPTADDPYGSLKDDDGSHDGTYADTEMLQDCMVFFDKLMDEADITPSNLPDSNPDEFQLYQALRKLTKPYNEYKGLISQSGSSDPTVTIIGPNNVGEIVWTRTGIGTYRGTLSGVFTDNKTMVSINNSATGYPDYDARIKRDDLSSISIITTNSGSLDDGILYSFEIKVEIYD